MSSHKGDRLKQEPFVNTVDGDSVDDEDEAQTNDAVPYNFDDTRLNEELSNLGGYLRGGRQIGDASPKLN